MPWHTVAAGENLSAIAQKYNLKDWHLIYEHPANKELFKGRSPDDIHEGEKIFVPDQLPVIKTGTLSIQATAFKRISGYSMVTPEVALKILSNLGKGEYPWRPDLGNFGGSSYFVSEGNPYTGTDASKSVKVEVDLILPKDAPSYNEAKLKALFQEEHAKVSAQNPEQAYRQYNKIPADKLLNGDQRKGLSTYIKKLAERRMWERIGREVAQSSSKCAEVLLEPGSEFSKQGSGKFAVMADRTKILLKANAPTQLLQSLDGLKIEAEPVVVEASEKLLQSMKWAGRVRSVFRWGGRLFLVVGIATDVYKVVVAQDKVKAVVESAGGWTGAGASASAFAAWFTPADSAGPWAWAAHGVGTLIAGGVGYWAGSKVTRTIYEMVVVEEW